MDESDKYELLKKEVDSIQIQLNQESGPWYSKPSNLISVIALIFSFGTTLVSAINSHNEDVRSNHREVLSVIQRITNLPIENFELMQEHEGSATGQALSGYINQENVLLATQAANLIKRYPNSFNSAELKAVAAALMESNITDKVPYFLRMAIDKADNASDYTEATRWYGSYLFSIGDFAEGRKHFQLALKVWDIFPERNLFIVNDFDVITLLSWAESEIRVGHLEMAQSIIEQAKEKHSRLPAGFIKEALRNRISFLSGRINQSDPVGPR